MMEQHPLQQQQQPHAVGEGDEQGEVDRSATAIVSAGEEDEEDDEDFEQGDAHEDHKVDDDDDIFSEAGDAAKQIALQQNQQEEEQDDHNAEELYYDENMDEDDAAYVYQYLRSGNAATTTGRSQFLSPTLSSSSPSAAGNNIQAAPKHPHKQRHSDAVLSCPASFNIVCMDCQRHERYPDQFRAMFVMGIVVHWQSLLIYDEQSQQLIPKPNVGVPSMAPSANQPEARLPHDIRHVPMDDDDDEDNAPHHHDLPKNNSNSNKNNEDEDDEGDEVYYSVHCGNCGTQVAALDMTDEVYHFFGCLASA